jgi:signal transduction histidine kinase/CheY-like chemotaxis protein
MKDNISINPWELLSGMPAGVLVMDRHFHAEYINPVISRYFTLYDLNTLLEQCRRGEAVPLYYAEQPDKMIRFSDLSIVKAFNSGFKTKSELLLFYFDEKKYFIDMVTNPIIDEYGKVTASVTIINNHTDRFNKNILLRQSVADAEYKSQIKDKYLANISHEIRTPMTSILGYISLMQQTELTDEQYLYSNAVKSAGTNMLNIINDLLDVSKIEQGRLQLNIKKFAVRDLCNSVLIMMRQLIEEKDIHLDFKIDEAIPEYLEGDPVRITQIIVNLLSNAIKFTEEGSVSLALTLLDTSDNDHHLIQIAVKDTGIGIEPEKINVIFDRFTQATEDISRTYGGAGLGLSIVKNIVDLANGQIVVKSTPGVGSEFQVTMMFKEVEMEELHQKKSKVKLMSSFKVNILVAEDNPLNQKLVKTILDRLGVNTTIAGDGQKAYDILLEGHKFDLILMDIQMPKMDGYTVTEKIRKELNLQVPIVAMTAHALEGEKDRCLKSGMSGFLAKPFKYEELVETINIFCSPAMSPNN